MAVKTKKAPVKNKKLEEKNSSLPQPVFTPLSDYEIKLGKRDNPHSSSRWLAEWSVWEKERLKTLAKRSKF